MNKYYALSYSGIIYYNTLGIPDLSHYGKHLKVLEKLIHSGRFEVGEIIYFHLATEYKIMDQDTINRLDKLMVFS